MQEWLKRRAHRKLVNYIRTRYDRFFPEPCRGMFNYQCHRNSVNYVLSYPSRNLQVVECIYIDNGDPILHYVVFDPTTGQYKDVTLGHFVANYPEFYKIRTVHPADYLTIEAEFERSMRGWKEQFVHPLLRWAVDRLV